MYYTLQTLLNQDPNFSSLPSKKEEKWRFSPLYDYLDTNYKKEPDFDEKLLFTPPDKYWLYLKNGKVLQEQLPSFIDVKTCSLNHDVKDNPFASLSSSVPYLGLYINKDIELHLYFDYADESFILSALNLVIKENLDCRIYMHFVGASKSFISHTNNIKLLPHSSLHLYQLQDLDPSALIICENSLFLDESSSVENFLLLKGAAYAQHFIHATLGYLSQLDISSLLLAKQTQKEFFSCDINHLADKSVSNVLSKQVLKDSSVALFDANTKIERQIKGAQVKQASHALLLDKKARIHALPHLEIYTDELTASHGSTVGDLDANSINYLLSRGINKEKVREMLISAFINETLENLDEATKKIVLEKIKNYYKGA